MKKSGEQLNGRRGHQFPWPHNAKGEYVSPATGEPLDGGVKGLPPYLPQEVFLSQSASRLKEMGIVVDPIGNGRDRNLRALANSLRTRRGNGA